jgi:hypothetical protein
MQYTYQRNIEARSRNHCCRRKAISNNYIYRMCVCSLSYPACKAHAWYVACADVPCFTTLPHKRYDSRVKNLLNVKCGSWFSYSFCLKHFSFYDVFSEILPLPLRPCSMLQHLPTTVNFTFDVFHPVVYISKIKWYSVYATVKHNYLLKQYYNIKGGNMFRLIS